MGCLIPDGTRTRELEAFKLPVDGVVMSKIDDKQRCPAGTLRGKLYEADLSGSNTDPTCWEAYLCFMPGVGTNFGKPPL
eukprot:783004-Pleurochrysis_carterae.AAC.1